MPARLPKPVTVVQRAGSLPKKKSYEFTLPLLTGVRGDAARLVGAARLPTNLADVEVVINARSTLAGTASFADELIRTLLVDRSAYRVVIDGVGASLGQSLSVAAERYSVAHRLILNVGTFQA